MPELLGICKKTAERNVMSKKQKELDDFERTGRIATALYIIKWLTDYITEFGVDGYRADTVKHTPALRSKSLNSLRDMLFRILKE
jgi:alpha-amylase